MKFKAAEHNPKHDVNSCCCVDCVWEYEEAKRLKKEAKAKKKQQEIAEINRRNSIIPADAKMKVLKWPKL